MPRKPEDLSDNVHSIGGAMSKWPLRTITWTCREERVGITDPNAVEAMLQVDAEDLFALEERAKNVGIRTEELYDKRHAIESADSGDVIDAAEDAYRAEYGDESGEWSEVTEECPFEETGLDKACWRCPVPAEAMNRLRGRGYEG